MLTQNLDTAHEKVVSGDRRATPSGQEASMRHYLSIN